MTKRKPLEVHSIRLDAKKLEEAAAKGIDVNELLRKALDQAVDEDRCPSCGQRLKSKSPAR